MYFVCANTWFYDKNRIIVHGMCSVGIPHCCVLAVRKEIQIFGTCYVKYKNAEVTAVAIPLTMLVCIFNAACCGEVPYLDLNMCRTVAYLPSAPEGKPLCLNRQSRVVTGFLTGHNTLRRHLFLLGLANSPVGRGCSIKEETSAHVLCECEAWASLRHMHLGSSFLEPGDINPYRTELNPKF
jgi:hypothetical protein